MKTTSVTYRISPEKKSQAEKIAQRLGMNLSEAISIFVSTFIEERGIPFAVKLPPVGFSSWDQFEDEVIAAHEATEDGTAEFVYNGEELRRWLNED